MKKLRFRAVGVMAVVATVAAVFVFTQAPANAATIIYTCTGASNDTGGYNDTFFGPQYLSSAAVLNQLASAGLGISATPEVSVSIATTSRPASVAADSGPFNVAFDFSATLPDSLITAASGLGLSQVTVQNASFDVNVVGAAPSPITGGFATRTVPLSPTPVKVSQAVTGALTPTGAVGSNILYKPGTAKLSIVLNIQILLLHIKTLTLSCTPSDSVIDATVITSGTGATTTPTTVATTTTPATTTTVAPTTTTTPPTTTTTVAPTTTTTPPTTTTTVAPTTTTTPPTTTTGVTTTVAPTTTATPPQPGSDAVIVNVTGSYSYTNSGNVSGPGYKISSDGFGVSSVSGSGDLAGKPSGTAHVSVQVSRFLFWSFGNITVRDASAGIPNLQAVVFFGPAPSLSGHSATMTGNWFTFDNFQFKPFTITATFTDAG